MINLVLSVGLLSTIYFSVNVDQNTEMNGKNDAGY